MKLNIARYNKNKLKSHSKKKETKIILSKLINYTLKQLHLFIINQQHDSKKELCKKFKVDPRTLDAYLKAAGTSYKQLRSFDVLTAENQIKNYDNLMKAPERKNLNIIDLTNDDTETSNPYNSESNQTVGFLTEKAFEINRQQELQTQNQQTSSEVANSHDNYNFLLSNKEEELLLSLLEPIEEKTTESSNYFSTMSDANTLSINQRLTLFKDNKKLIEKPSISKTQNGPKI